MIGEAVLGLNGPFLFQRFGMNVPGAAAVGALVGAVAGYQIAEALLRVRSRKRVGSAAQEPQGAVPLRHA